LPDHATQDELVAAMIEERRARIARAVEERGASPEFIEEYRQAVGDMVGIDLSNPDVPVAERIDSREFPGYRVEQWVLRIGRTGAVIPAELWIPDNRLNASVDLHVEGELSPGSRNRDGFYDQIVRSGTITGMVGLYRRSRATQDIPRTSDKFPDTFVPTDTAFRTQDVLAAVAWISRQTGNSPVRLMPKSIIGFGNEVACVLAAALAPEWVTTRVSQHEFPQSNEQWVRLAYLPSLQSLGGVRLIAQTLAPGRVTIEE
jgi:hypothetical protein